MNAQVKEYFLETYGLEKTVDLLFHVLDSIPVSVFIKKRKIGDHILQQGQSGASRAICRRNNRLDGPPNSFARECCLFHCTGYGVLNDGKIRKSEESLLRHDASVWSFSHTRTVLNWKMAAN